MFSKQNLYPGINAHLNSWLQAQGSNAGEWESFHAHHIGHLLEVVDAALPDGYYARSEKSLQIGAIDRSAPAATRRIRRPDVSVYQSQAGQAATGRETNAQPASMTLPLVDTFPETLDLNAIEIYEIRPGSALHKPVARIELLSPSNKPTRSGYMKYLDNRLEALRSGLRLVEIDYLHTLPAISPNMPQYPTDADSYPYSVLVSDPRPTFEQGHTSLYGWQADEPAPIIAIPLSGTDTGLLDLGQAYKRTFTGIRFYHLLVDYAEAPVNMARYSSDDQQRIQTQLESIRQHWRA